MTHLKQNKTLYLWFTFYIIIAIIIVKIVPLIIGNCQGDSDTCWKKNDSSLYISIAEKGYFLEICKETLHLPKNEQTYCGNCGWAPLYPFLIKILNPLFPHFAATGVFISFVFSLASLFLLLYYLKSIKQPFYYVYGFLFLFFFGGVYYWAVFPISLTVFLLFCIVLSIMHNKPILAGISAMCMVWAYSSGMFIILALGIYFANEVRLYGFNKTKKAIFWTLGLPSLSVITLFTFMHFQVGNWKALFMVQAKYGHTLHLPTKLVVAYVQKIYQDWGKLSMCIPIIYVLTFILLFSLLSYQLYKEKKHAFLLLGLVLAFFLLPFCLGVNLSFYRSIALLSPVLVFVRINKWWHLVMLIIIMGCLYFPLFKMFTVDLLN